VSKAAVVCERDSRIRKVEVRGWIGEDGLVDLIVEDFRMCLSEVEKKDFCFLDRFLEQSCFDFLRVLRLSCDLFLGMILAGKE
jgi:hypothetical protein